MKQDRKQNFIMLMAILHKHLKGADADNDMILKETMKAAEETISERLPEPMSKEDKLKKTRKILDALALVAPKDGVDGKDGADGEDGVDGVDGKNGLDGLDGEDATPPTDKELLKLIKPLIPNPEKLDKEELRDFIRQSLPEDVAKDEVSETVIIYVESVIGRLQRSISSKTYDAEEIVGLVEFIQDNSEDSDGPFDRKYRAATSTDTVTNADYLVDCNGTFTVTLPTAVGIEGQHFVIKNSGSGIITIDGDGTETIDGNLTVNLPQYDSITVVSTGSEYIII